MFRYLFILLAFPLQSAAQNTGGGMSVYFDQPEVLRKAGIKTVRYIFKDHRKLIWIGTENGLYRYDGTNTVYLRHKPADTTTIPNNTLVNIAEDKKGNIWIGTLGGVGCINPNNLKCKVYRSELRNLSGNFDNRVLIGPNDEIWTGNSEGFFLLDQKENRFKKIWDEPANRPFSGYVTYATYWQKDTVVLGTFTNLVLFNVKNFGFKRLQPLNRELLVTRLLVDRAHRLWIGTWGEGVIVSDPVLKQFQSYKWEKDLPTGVDNIVTGLVQTSASGSSHVWVGSSNWIGKIPVEADSVPALASVASYLVDQKQHNRDPGTINCMMADDENNIWTGGDVVAKFSADKNRFETFPLSLRGLVQNIQTINVGSGKYLAISMWHGDQGLVLIDQQTGQMKTINSVNAHDQYGANISGLAVDKTNRVWLASLGGAYILNDRFSFIHDLSKPLHAADALTRKKTNYILIHHETVWIACYKNGIDLFSLDGHKLKHFIDNDGSGMRDGLFSNFFEDSRGNLWICGNSHFYKFLDSSSSFKIYDFSIEHSQYGTFDIAELPDGHLVIATETGLINFDPVTEKFFKISTPLLEKEEEVESVCVDGKGDVWYLTLNHLVHYQTKSGKFTLFGEEDGLDIEGLQCIRTFDGKEILLANQSRLLKFTPGNWEKKVSPPQILMHAIQVNDSAVRSAEPITELKLNYDENKLYFEFDGISYTKPEQNQYAYRLQGIDKDWIISNKNSTSYSNLAPGEYEFHVKAANYAGVWSEEKMISIFIRPPFWLTWWFISLSVLALGAVFVLVVRYISQRNLREKILKLEKEQAVEKERNRIARDMHDDLGSGLTKIAILSEVAKAQLRKKDDAVVQLEKISYSSRELVDNLQDIIWVLNPKNDSLDNLAAYIREYALKFFDTTDTQVHFQYPQQIPAFKLSEEQRRNIFMVIKESLNNIAKHASSTQVELTLQCTNQGLEISIGDDGKGFDTDSIRHFANGLTNMKARMEQINGQYSIHSCPGQGTVTKLAVPF